MNAHVVAVLELQVVALDQALGWLADMIAISILLKVSIFNKESGQDFT